MSDWIFDWGSIPGLPDPASITNWLDNLSGLHALNDPQAYLRSDDGHLTIVSDARGHGGGGTGGTGTGTGSPTSTVVGSSSGLQINLIWDTSVQSASNWSAVEQAVVTAAQIFTTDFNTHALLNIHVGLGEVNGSKLASGALGESETQGYLVSYSTLTKALATADAGLVTAGQMAAGAVTAVSALASKTFFVASAEAKALGLVSATSTSTDGYIGFTAGSALAFAGTVGASQYDAIGVAAHEISEVMGRIGMEGSQGYYTPLDLFRYTAPNQPDLTSAAGIFSTNMGQSAVNYFNAGSNGGDSADWATRSSNATDAFDAFGNPGVTTQVTSGDLLAVAVLGYHPVGALTTVTA